MIIPSRYQSAKKSFDGGMSTARLFTDTHLDRKVIIKELQPGAHEKRLLDEIRALSTVRSKYVVEIYDVIRDEDGKLAALVEEFIPGEDLLTKAGKSDAHEIMRIGAALAAGLADIHHHGQIHRDIKLNNLKIDAEGCLKIFDFGLSRKDESAATTGLVGTIGYIAPELCAQDGEIVEFSQAVDVFAFASTILRLALGKFPKDLKNIPPKLPCDEANFHLLPLALPAEICNILNSCHAVAPSDRPTMADVSEIFSRHMLEGKHRATLVVGSNVYILNNSNKSVTISAGNIGKCTVYYDGQSFLVSTVSGSIYVNNAPVIDPKTVTGSCVITMGPPSAGLNRVYVPVDVSYPELVL